MSGRSESRFSSAPSTAENANPYSMTEEILKQRAEHENTGRYSSQLYAGVVASVSSISFGAVLGWSSPAVRESLDNSEEHPEDAKVEICWITSMGPLGCALGVIVWSYFNIKIGPKKTMVIQSPLLFVTWVVLAIVRKLDVALAGRFFCGFLAISYRVCGETLLIDSVHKLNLRNMLIPCRSCVCLGVLFAYILGYTMSDMHFSILNCLIVTVHFFMLLACPESPVFLYDICLLKAEAALSWYRGRENIYTDMRNIKRDSEIRKVEPAAYKYMFFSKVVVKALLVVIVLFIVQAFSGYYIFLYYNIAIVKRFSNLKLELAYDATIDEKADIISRNVDSIILGLTMFLSSLVSTWVHARVLFGVKKPLLLSCILATVHLTGLSVYFFLREKKEEFVWEHGKWIYLVLIIGIVISHDIGLSACPNIILLDYTPYQVYPRAQLIAKFFQWMFIFLITTLYFPITNLVNASTLMAIFAFISLGSIIFVILCVVESKGKTLLQVQAALGGNPIGSRGGHGRLFDFGNHRNIEIDI